jgi:hypothetical protein
MGYYLKWSEDSGDKVTNAELLQISGVSGTLISIEYVVKTSSVGHSNPRYIFDIRRLVGSSTSGGGTGYIYQSSETFIGANGTSNRRKNGVVATDNDFFNGYVAGDIFSFDVGPSYDVGTIPSGGAFAFGARFNEKAHNYGFSVSSIIVEDSDGLHTIDMSDSGGSGTSLTSTDGSITATLFNFPTDDSQWVFYAPPAVTPINPSVTNLLATSARLTWDQG